MPDIAAKNMCNDFLYANYTKISLSINYDILSYAYCNLFGTNETSKQKFCNPNTNLGLKSVKSVLLYILKGVKWQKSLQDF